MRKSIAAAMMAASAATAACSHDGEGGGGPTVSRGYQVGNFPILWSEWNGRYRDCVRRFWKGHGGSVGELASRLAGSSDLACARSALICV